MIIDQDDKPPLEELALTHHGVKGMHWGIRRRSANSGSSGGSSAKKLAKQQKNDARNKEIDKARVSVAKRQEQERMALQVKSGSERVTHILTAVGTLGVIGLMTALQIHTTNKSLGL